jgi:hypothetical protein
MHLLFLLVSSNPIHCFSFFLNPKSPEIKTPKILFLPPIWLEPQRYRVLKKQLPILRKTTPRPSGHRDYCLATSRRPAEDIKMLRQSFGSRFPNSVMRFGSRRENFRDIQKKNHIDEWHTVPQTSKIVNIYIKMYSCSILNSKFTRK